MLQHAGTMHRQTTPIALHIRIGTIPELVGEGGTGNEVGLVEGALGFGEALSGVFQGVWQVPRRGISVQVGRGGAGGETLGRGWESL